MNISISTQDAALGIRKVVGLLVLLGILAVGSICTGAYTVYFKTEHLLRSRDAVEHTQAVIAVLQAQSLRLERVDTNMQLQMVTGDELHAKVAHTSAAAIDIGILRLQDLVKDNLSQTRHTLELERAAERLSRAIDISVAKRQMPDEALRSCQAVLNVMLEEERELLLQRTEETRQSLSRSLYSGVGYLGFSVFMVSLLFGFLLLDAFRRTNYETLLTATNLELAATIKEQVRRSGEAALLLNARDELQLCVSLKQAHKCIARHLSNLLPGSQGATLTINNSRRMVEIAESWNSPETLADGFELEACCGLRTGRARWRNTGSSEVNCTHFIGSPPENYLCIPLAAHGETLGFIYIECASAEMAAQSEQRVSLLNEMVELASLSIASLNLKAKLENQSIRDGLTNLFNRRFMESALEREVHRAVRRKSSLALIMIDVDHFKTFNDTFGHEAGDVVLREVAQSLKVAARAEDIVCRFGGEEFIIILPEISKKTALERAELIRQRVSAIQVHFRGDPLRKISISLGMSMFPETASTGDDLIRDADQALYKAKAMGRDQVQMCLASSLV